MSAYKAEGKENILKPFAKKTEPFYANDSMS